MDGYGSLELAFGAFDANNDDSLEVWELALFTSMSVYDIYDEIVVPLDTDADDELSFEEFSGVISQMRDRNHVCIFAFAQDIRQKTVTEYVPLYAPLLEAPQDLCIDTCMAGVPPLETQTTFTCPEDEVLSKYSSCGTCEEVVHGCVVCSDFDNPNDRDSDSSTSDDLDPFFKYNNCV